MLFNKEKMIRLILNESESIEEEYEGYRKHVLDAIVEILNAEREHAVQKTNIQKRIDAACHNVGNFLARKRNIDNPTTEVTQ